MTRELKASFGISLCWIWQEQMCRNMFLTAWISSWVSTISSTLSGIWTVRFQKREQKIWTALKCFIICIPRRFMTLLTDWKRSIAMFSLKPVHRAVAELMWAHFPILTNAGQVTTQTELTEWPFSTAILFCDRLRQCVRGWRTLQASTSLAHWIFVSTSLCRVHSDLAEICLNIPMTTRRFPRRISHFTRRFGTPCSLAICIECQIPMKTKCW